MRTWLWLLAFFAAQSVADPSPVSRSFQVQAVVANGCVFGTTMTSSASDLGTIDFGTVTDLASGRLAASSVGNGSIVLTCTPGMTVRIALGNGLNGSSTSDRLLKRVGGTETLAYQLFQDAGYSIVWGAGTEAVTIGAASTVSQTYTVFARLLPRSDVPTAGEYRDTVVVELSY